MDQKVLNIGGKSESLEDRLGRIFSRNVLLRKLFYKILDLLILRCWHVYREIKIWARDHPGHMHILDAGAGFGQYTYFMAKLDPRYSILAVDIKAKHIGDSNEFFRKAEFPNVYFKRADLNEFIQPAGFDMILTVNLLNYIKDDHKLLTNIYHNLKPDGILLLANPSEQSFEELEMVKTLHAIEPFRKGYAMSELKEKLKQIGFSKVKARYSYGKPGYVAWKLSIKYPTRLLQFSKYLVVLLPFYFLLTLPPILVLSYMDTHFGHTSGRGIILKAWK